MSKKIKSLNLFYSPSQLEEEVVIVEPVIEELPITKETEEEILIDEEEDSTEEPGPD